MILSLRDKSMSVPYIFRCLMLAMVLIGVSGAFSVTQANEPGDVRSLPVPSETIIDMGADREQVESPSVFTGFARPGTKLRFFEDADAGVSFHNVPVCNRPDMSCHELPGTHHVRPEATITCRSNGTWDVNIEQGSCFLPPFGCCYRNNNAEIVVDHGCRVITPTADDIFRTSGSYMGVDLDDFNCVGSDNLSTPSEKELCIFNQGGSAGISGDTGDDMFRLREGGGAYFVFRIASTQPYYIYRDPFVDTDGDGFGDTHGEREDPIMIPTGPAGTHADFWHFINNPPPFVHIEKACPPFAYKLCGSLAGAMPPPPAVDGVCGNAHGEEGYKTLEEIPEEELCNFGDFLAVTATEDEIRWVCTPPAEFMSGGGLNVDCAAGRAYDGECGTAASEPNVYEDGAEIDEADRCVHAGAATNKAQTTTEISWQCDGINGGEPVQCSVARKIVCAEGQELYPDGSGCGDVFIVYSRQQEGDSGDTAEPVCGSNIDGLLRCGSGLPSTETRMRNCSKADTFALHGTCLSGWDCPEDSFPGSMTTTPCNGWTGDASSPAATRCVEEGQHASPSCLP